jgi:hypothetical protein
VSNTWRILLIAFFIVASPCLTPAATTADQAVFNVINGADPTLVNRKVLHRNAVASDLDLVIAMGSPAEWPLDPDSPAIWWDEKRKLGVFLQERARPDRVYSLALAAGSLDCGARIERATSTDTVISCAGEKGYQGLNQKFVYDIRAKALALFVTPVLQTLLYGIMPTDPTTSPAGPSPRQFLGLLTCRLAAPPAWTQ